jgi:hypothetical protein
MQGTLAWLCIDCQLFPLGFLGFEHMVGSARLMDFVRTFVRVSQAHLEMMTLGLVVRSVSTGLSKAKIASPESW